MTRFAILLGGDLTVTARLRGQIRGARVIAADSGMMHAATLGVVPELWVGDFDSAGSELTMQFRDVPRETFSPEKDATDGAIAVEEAIRRGAREIVLLGGWAARPTMRWACSGRASRSRGRASPACSPAERRKPGRCIPGRMAVALPAGTRISIIPFGALEGLDLSGVKWPLSGRDVPVGSTLTLSNVALGPVEIALRAGYGVAVAYPPGDSDD